MTTICICGAGTMGSGIAQVCATAGFVTIMYDVNDRALQKAKQKIESDLEKLVAKQKIAAEQREKIINKLAYTSNVSSCKADLVMEAIVEQPAIKIALFNQLAAINSPATVFASNTSSLSITALAKEIHHPQRVAGLHFFNPAPLMKLVEVVQGHQTSRQVIEQLLSFARQLGKTPVLCKDAPGFIVNRVARPFYIESLRIAEEGGASYETIDHLVENCGFKLGPFKLMDLIGNDINYAVSCSVYEQLDFPERLKPSFLQKEKVDKGELGKKTGKGFYSYDAPIPP